MIKILNFIKIALCAFLFFVCNVQANAEITELSCELTNDQIKANADGKNTLGNYSINGFSGYFLIENDVLKIFKYTSSTQPGTYIATPKVNGFIRSIQIEITNNSKDKIIYLCNINNLGNAENDNYGSPALTNNTTVFHITENTDQICIYATSAIYIKSIKVTYQPSSTLGYYQLITSTPSNWEGEYLIVYNNTYAMGTHFGEQNTNTYAIGIDISEYYSSTNNIILTNSEVDKLAYIAKNSNAGHTLYSIIDNSYLGIIPNTTDAGKNLRWYSSYQNNACDWTLGINKIRKSENNGLSIKWNDAVAAKYFGAYYNTNKDIQLFKKIKNSAISLIAQDGNYYYATFSYALPVKFTDEETHVYAVNVSNNHLDLTEIESKEVPANTGVLIKTTETEASFSVITSAATIEDNLLMPSTGGTTIGENCKFYRLAYNDYTNKTGLGFYYGPNCNDGGAFTCKAGTAYLAVPNSLQSRAKSFPFGNTVTEIQNTSPTIITNNKIYNINGQEVNEDTKGFVIINGKKVYR